MLKQQIDHSRSMASLSSNQNQADMLKANNNSGSTTLQTTEATPILRNRNVSFSNNDSSETNSMFVNDKNSKPKHHPTNSLNINYQHKQRPGFEKPSSVVPFFDNSYQHNAQQTLHTNENVAADTQDDESINLIRSFSYTRGLPKSTADDSTNRSLKQFLVEEGLEKQGSSDEGENRRAGDMLDDELLR